MAGSLNRCQLIGRLGKDPELKYTAGGTPICKFSLATDESWKDKDGEKKTVTTWHNIVAWNKLAEVCGEYLQKGKQVYLEGKIQHREWEDNDGNKKYATDIVISNMVMLGSKGEGNGKSTSKRSSLDEGLADEDIPF